MSKTYRKNVRVGICTGSNTEFYRERRRTHRRKVKNKLKKLQNSGTKEDMENVQLEKLIKRNSWEELTDGTVTYRSKQDAENRIKFNMSFLKQVLRQFKKK